MPDKYQFNSRMNRHRKKKNSKKTAIYVIILSLIFILLLITLVTIITSDNNDGDSHSFMNNNDEEDNNLIDREENEEEDLNESTQSVKTNNQVDNNNNEDEMSTNDVTKNEPLSDVEVVDESEDDNVIRTYIGNWEPIGTVQTGEHITNFNNGSVDRIEIEKASSNVTGIPVDEMFVGWVGNDGHQKVFTIISNQDRDEFYKLYLTWIDEEGWQVTKVEKIKEFDIDEYRQ